MIITDLQADNFRKYRTLYLENLPERGLVVVSGGNESGKTSIGDAISFVLFGRTDTLTGVRVGKLVLWGAEAATVMLTFRQREQSFRLTRSVDKAGTQTASLAQVEGGAVLADTLPEVNQQLQELLGFSYAAFVRTFYWSQQISQVPQADADSLQSMAGIRAYARLSEQLEQERQDDQHALEALDGGHQANHSAREALQLDQRHLPDLLEIRETLEDRQHSSQVLAQRLAQAGRTYPGERVAYHSLSQRSSRIGRLVIGGVLLLLLVLLVWGGLFLFPHWVAGVWPESVSYIGSIRGLLWAGVVIAGLTSLLLIYGWHLERNRLNPLRERAETLSSTLQEGVDHLEQPWASADGSKAGHYLQEHALLPGSDHPEGEADKLVARVAVPEGWHEQVRDYTASPDQVAHAVGTVTHELDQHGTQLDASLQVVSTEVEQERGRVEQFATLSRELTEQEAHIQHYQHDLQVKGKALELVKQASRYSVGRFNAIVHKRCQGLLSEFTQSHYQQLEIDNDFALHVLSQEKGGYLDFEEISAGTQRQIGLAMRMALSNSLADSCDTGPQFLYLDEPFAFFDAPRTAATLGSLQASTQGNLSQIWVTVQEVPTGLSAGKIIHCQSGDAVLHV